MDGKSAKMPYVILKKPLRDSAYHKWDNNKFRKILFKLKALCPLCGGLRHQRIICAPDPLLSPMLIALRLLEQEMVAV